MEFVGVAASKGNERTRAESLLLSAVYRRSETVIKYTYVHTEREREREKWEKGGENVKRGSEVYANHGVLCDYYCTFTRILHGTY